MFCVCVRACAYRCRGGRAPYLFGVIVINRLPLVVKHTGKYGGRARKKNAQVDVDRPAGAGAAAVKPRHRALYIIHYPIGRTVAHRRGDRGGIRTAKYIDGKKRASRAFVKKRYRCVCAHACSVNLQQPLNVSPEP